MEQGGVDGSLSVGHFVRFMRRGTRVFRVNNVIASMQRQAKLNKTPACHLDHYSSTPIPESSTTNAYCKEGGIVKNTG